MMMKRMKKMTEYIIYGAVAIICFVVFVIISMAKAKIGWSWINEEEE